jgi:EpsI family protein
MKLKLLVMIVYLSLLSLYTYGLRSEPAKPADAALDRLPLEVSGYVGVDEPLNDRALDVLGADQAAYRQYRRGEGRPIWVFLGYFGSPRENSQIHSPKHCYPGAGWTILDESTKQVRINDRDVVAKTLLINNGERNQLVLYWFQTDSGVVTNEYALKWFQMKSALLKQSQRTTFVRLSTPVGGREDFSAAEEELTEFIGVITPHLLAALGAGGNKI